MRRLRNKLALRKPKDKAILAQEKELMVNYGLRNKKELRKTEFLVSKYHKLVRTHELKSNQVILALEKLKRLGVIKQGSKDQILYGLTVHGFLNRRLCTLVAKIKNISMNYARQLITHGHVKVNGVLKRYPSYLIRLQSEIQIK